MVCIFINLNGTAPQYLVDFITYKPKGTRFTRSSIDTTLLTSQYAQTREKVYFKSQILVHEYWTILNHFGVPVLFASGCHQHVLRNVNITFSGNTGTPEMFQHSPILGCSSIWDLKYTFSQTSIGDKSFCISGPSLWNSLPKNIREAHTLSGFKKGLKSYLYPS